MDERMILLCLYPLTALIGFTLSLFVRKHLTVKIVTLPLKLNGDSLTDGLRAFNEWRDDFLIELSTLMLMVGFIVGTVDVFTQGGLSSVPVFNYSWAIIQAIAIDGLFFAVWGRIRRATWTWRKAFNNLMMIIVGLLLAIVASLVNGLLSYQELNHVANVAQAMQHLGVDQSTFTYFRAILVVLVSVLVALFGRTYTNEQKTLEQQYHVAQKDIARLRAENDGLREQLAQATGSKRSPRKATIVHEEKATDGLQATDNKGYVAQGTQAIAIAEKATGYAHGATHSPEQEATQATDSPEATGYVAADDGSTIAVANGNGQSMLATGSHRDRIKQAMLQAVAQQKELDYKDIAQVAGVGYSTVKKWAGEVRAEIKQELAQDTQSTQREEERNTDSLERINA